MKRQKMMTFKGEDGELYVFNFVFDTEDTNMKERIKKRWKEVLWFGIDIALDWSDSYQASAVFGHNHQAWDDIIEFYNDCLCDYIEEVEGDTYKFIPTHIMTHIARGSGHYASYPMRNEIPVRIEKNTKGQPIVMERDEWVTYKRHGFRHGYDFDRNKIYGCSNNEMTVVRYHSTYKINMENEE